MKTSSKRHKAEEILTDIVRKINTRGKRENDSIFEKRT